MPDQNPLDPLADRLDQIIDAHREVMLADGRTLLATERKAIVTFARVNGRRPQKLWRWVEIGDHARVTKADFAWCRVDNITALARCTQIQTLLLSGNSISDISALARHGDLVRLDLGLNDLKDISALASCRRLEKLSLSRNEVADISALATCAQLAELDLQYNRIIDISPLASCSMLERVDLSFNHRLSDISALESCPRLRRVDVLGTRLSETSKALLAKLEARGVVVFTRLWPLRPSAWQTVSETAAVSCVVAPAPRRPGPWRLGNTRRSWGNADAQDSRRRIAIGADDPNPIL